MRNLARFILACFLGLLLSVLLQDARIALLSSSANTLLIALIYWGLGFSRPFRRADWNPKVSFYSTAAVAFVFATMTYVGEQMSITEKLSQSAEEPRPVRMDELCEQGAREACENLSPDLRAFMCEDGLAQACRTSRDLDAAAPSQRPLKARR